MNAKKNKPIIGVFRVGTVFLFTAFWANSFCTADAYSGKDSALPRIRFALVELTPARSRNENTDCNMNPPLK